MSEPENLHARALDGMRLWALQLILDNARATSPEGEVCLVLSADLALQLAGACEMGARALWPLPADPEEEGADE